MENELQEEATALWLLGSHDACLQTLQKLESSHGPLKEFPKAAHNLALVEYYCERCKDPAALIQQLDALAESQSHPNTARPPPPDPTPPSPPTPALAARSLSAAAAATSSSTTTTAPAAAAAAAAASAAAPEFTLDPGVSEAQEVARVCQLNKAILMFQQGHYAKAIKLLEPSYSELEALDDSHALLMCTLLMDCHLAQHQPQLAASVLLTLERTCSSSSSTQPSHTHAQHSTGSMTSTQQQQQQQHENSDHHHQQSGAVLALPTVTHCGSDTMARARTLLQQQGAHVLPIPDTAIVVQLYRAELLLRRGAPHAAKHELRPLLAQCASSLPVALLQARLEAMQGSAHNAAMLLLNLHQQQQQQQQQDQAVTKAGSSTQVALLNNLGLVHHQLGNHGVATLCLERALTSQATQPSWGPWADSTVSSAASSSPLRPPTDAAAQPPTDAATRPAATGAAAAAAAAAGAGAGAGAAGGSENRAVNAGKHAAGSGGSGGGGGESDLSSGSGDGSGGRAGGQQVGVSVPGGLNTPPLRTHSSSSSKGQLLSSHPISLPADATSPHPDSRAGLHNQHSPSQQQQDDSQPAHHFRPHVPSTSSAVVYNLGVQHLVQGQWEAARACFHKAGLGAHSWSSTGAATAADSSGFRGVGGERGRGREDDNGVGRRRGEPNQAAVQSVTGQQSQNRAESVTGQQSQSGGDGVVVIDARGLAAGNGVVGGGASFGGGGGGERHHGSRGVANGRGNGDGGGHDSGNGGGERNEGGDEHDHCNQLRHQPLPMLRLAEAAVNLHLQRCQQQHSHQQQQQQQDQQQQKQQQQDSHQHPQQPQQQQQQQQLHYSHQQPNDDSELLEEAAWALAAGLEAMHAQLGVGGQLAAAAEEAAAAEAALHLASMEEQAPPTTHAGASTSAASSSSGSHTLSLADSNAPSSSSAPLSLFGTASSGSGGGRDGVPAEANVSGWGEPDVAVSAVPNQTLRARHWAAAGEATHELQLMARGVPASWATSSAAQVHQALLTNLAFVHLLRGDHLQALQAAQTLLDLPDGAVSPSAILMGRCYAAEAQVGMGNSTEAEAYLSAAVSQMLEQPELLAPSSASPFMAGSAPMAPLLASLAFALCTERRHEQARGFVERALACDSSFRPACLLLVWLELAQGNATHALQLLKRSSGSCCSGKAVCALS